MTGRLCPRMLGHGMAAHAPHTEENRTRTMEYTKDTEIRAEDVRAGDLIDMDEVFGLMIDAGIGDSIPDADRYASQFEYANVEEVDHEDAAVIVYNDLRNVALRWDWRVIVRRPIEAEG